VLQQEAQLNDEQADCWDRAAASPRRLDDTIRNFLAYARPRPRRSRVSTCAPCSGRQQSSCGTAPSSRIGTA